MKVIDSHTHCFPDAVAGLAHDYRTISGRLADHRRSKSMGAKITQPASTIASIRGDAV